MKIFLAGATGVLGTRLVPLLLANGHEVAGMTRSPEKAQRLATLGALPVVCDVFDAEALLEAVVSFEPDAVMHQLTDLPDDPSRTRELAEANNRIRREGTRNLLTAADAAKAQHFIAQSVAWELSGDAGEAAADLEHAVLGRGGVVLRYGRLYGPGTYFEDEVPPPPRVHVDNAARRTVGALGAPSGIVSIVGR